MQEECNKELETTRLIRLYLRNDREAFNRLILMHKRLVFNICFRMLGDYDEADDCAQEVFIKVSRSLKGFRFGSRFDTWLYRIAVNTCKNRLNSKEYRLRSQKVRIDLERELDNGSKLMEIGDDSQSPTSEIINRQTGDLIQKAVDALPVHQKTVVVLRDIEGKSYEEIVEITGFKLGTVKSKLSRARQQLALVLRGKI
jgi:RNA polymerase sigma-70 factor (ECF subfamily)